MLELHFWRGADAVAKLVRETWESVMWRNGVVVAWALLALFSPSFAWAADPAGSPYYAAGSRAEGAVAFDMQTLTTAGSLRSVRVWQFSPTPIHTGESFKAGDIMIIEFDCVAGRVRFRDRALFTSIDDIELQPKLAEDWFPYKKPAGEPDNSLATTAWLLLCGKTVPRSWVAYDRLDMIALDYWSSLTPEAIEGFDAHGVTPPMWAGPNAAKPTGPKAPEPIIPW
ncbi:MAG: hypothetical protein EON59_01100 [Alphaproteobacteria bacterium]|nr:MAG: hypothetical protein EON59_01100 [Alphaproteobacteria bacterium]